MWKLMNSTEIEMIYIHFWLWKCPWNGKFDNLAHISLYLHNHWSEKCRKNILGNVNACVDWVYETFEFKSAYWTSTSTYTAKKRVCIWRFSDIHIELSPVITFKFQNGKYRLHISTRPFNQLICGVHLVGRAIGRWVIMYGSMDNMCLQNSYLC